MACGNSQALSKKSQISNCYGRKRAEDLSRTSGSSPADDCLFLRLGPGSPTQHKLGHQTLKRQASQEAIAATKQTASGATLASCCAWKTLI